MAQLSLPRVPVRPRLQRSKGIGSLHIAVRSLLCLLQRVLGCRLVLLRTCPPRHTSKSANHPCPTWAQHTLCCSSIHGHDMSERSRETSTDMHDTNKRPCRHTPLLGFSQPVPAGGCTCAHLHTRRPIGQQRRAAAAAGTVLPMLRTHRRRRQSPGTMQSAAPVHTAAHTAAGAPEVPRNVTAAAAAVGRGPHTGAQGPRTGGHHTAPVPLRMAAARHTAAGWACTAAAAAAGAHSWARRDSALCHVHRDACTQ